MVEPQELLDHVRWMLGRSGDLAGRDIVVTAGGTREPLDPVRVITNRSSGKMGYALAEAARDRGARVTLVAAPTDLPDPVGVALHRIETVREMRDAVLATTHYADVLVMAAAVSDYRPAEVADQKMKKEGTADTIALTLLKNADFLPELPSTVMRVGFAAETQNVLANARRKLEEKGLALIVANDVTDPDSGFGVDTNRVTLIDAQGDEELPLLPKYEVAHRVLDRVLLLLQQRDAAEGPVSPKTAPAARPPRPAPPPPVEVRRPHIRRGPRARPPGTGSPSSPRDAPSSKRSTSPWISIHGLSSSSATLPPTGPLTSTESPRLCCRPSPSAPRRSIEAMAPATSTSLSTCTPRWSPRS